jgi:hypothetical protein
MIPPGDERIGRDDNELFLRSIAALHARFWDAKGRALATPELCDLHDRYRLFSPSVIEPEVEEGVAVRALVMRGVGHLSVMG